MEPESNETPVMPATNLIDFCSSVEKVMAPLIPLPQILELNNDVSLHRDSFENNPFDRVLKEVQKDHIKKSDPFEITLDKTCSFNKKSNVNKMLAQENVPFICINDKSVNNKFTDEKKISSCRSSLFVTQEQSPEVLSANEISGKFDFITNLNDSSLQCLNNSILKESLISFDLCDEKVFNSHNIICENKELILDNINNHSSKKKEILDKVNTIENTQMLKESLNLFHYADNPSLNCFILKSESAKNNLNGRVIETSTSLKKSPESISSELSVNNSLSNGEYKTNVTSNDHIDTLGNKENVPLIYIDDNNINSKSMDKMEMIYRSPLLLLQDRFSDTFNNSEINGKSNSKINLNDSSFGCLSNSILKESLISLELNGEKKYNNLLDNMYENNKNEDLNSFNKNNQSTEISFYSNANIVKHTQMTNKPSDLFHLNDDPLLNRFILDSKKDIISFSNNYIGRTKSLPSSLSTQGHFSDSVTKISTLVNNVSGSFSSKLDTTDLLSSNKYGINTSNNDFTNSYMKTSFDKSFQNTEFRLSQNTKKIDKFEDVTKDIFNDSKFVCSKHDISKEYDDSIFLEANVLVNTFSKLATSSDDACFNSDEDLFNCEPNWNNEVFQNDTDNKIIKNIELDWVQKNKLLPNDILSENLNLSMLGNISKTEISKSKICSNNDSFKKNPHLNKDLLPEIKLNKSDYVNSKRKKMFNQSLSLIESLDSYNTVEECKNVVKSENAVKLLENITKVLKADDKDVKQRETLGENLIHSLVQVLNLDVHNISNFTKKDKSESSVEYQHNSTESVDENSLSDIIFEKSNYNKKDLIKHHNLSQKLHTLEKDKSKKSKIVRSRSLNISSVSRRSNSYNISCTNNKSVQKKTINRMVQSNSVGNLQDPLQSKYINKNLVDCNEQNDLKNKNIKKNTSLFQQTSSLTNIRINPSNTFHNKSMQKLSSNKMVQSNSEGNLQKLFTSKPIVNTDSEKISKENYAEKENIKNVTNISQYINKLKMKFSTNGNVDSVTRTIKRSPLKATLPISNMMKSKEKKEEIIRKKNCKTYVRNSLYITPPKKVLTSSKLKSNITPNESPVSSNLKPISQSTPKNIFSSKEINSFSTLDRQNIENLRNSDMSSCQPIGQMISNVSTLHRKDFQKSPKTNVLCEKNCLENSNTVILKNKAKLEKSNHGNNSFSKLKYTFSQKMNKSIINRNESFTETEKKHQIIGAEKKQK